MNIKKKVKEMKKQIYRKDTAKQEKKFHIVYKKIDVGFKKKNLLYTISKLIGSPLRSPTIF